jgi:hypothetical protein
MDIRFAATVPEIVHPASSPGHVEELHGWMLRRQAIAEGVRAAPPDRQAALWAYLERRGERHRRP